MRFLEVYFAFFLSTHALKRRISLRLSKRHGVVVGVRESPPDYELVCRSKFYFLRNFFHLSSLPHPKKLLLLPFPPPPPSQHFRLIPFDLDKLATSLKKTIAEKRGGLFNCLQDYECTLQQVESKFKITAGLNPLFLQLTLSLFKFYC